LSSRYSILIVCDNYGYRLGAALRHWMQQSVPPDRFQILVSNSSSGQDGVAEVVSSAARAWPRQELRLLDVPRGATKLQYQEDLVSESNGDVLVLVDADMLYPRDFVARIDDSGLGPHQLGWTERLYLSQVMTDEVLASHEALPDEMFDAEPRTPALQELERYSVGPAGYCHIYWRSAFDAVDGFSGLEVRGGRFGAYASTMVAKLQESGVVRDVRRIPGLIGLHMWHGENHGKENIDGTTVQW
jgi:hypothetical protein